MWRYGGANIKTNEAMLRNVYTYKYIYIYMRIQIYYTKGHVSLQQAYVRLLQFFFFISFSFYFFSPGMSSSFIQGEYFISRLIYP